MPIDQLQTSEAIVFNGATSVVTAAIVGMLIALAAGWLLWRDRQTLGTAWAAVFWMLRMTAVGLALWMLLEPMQETVERSNNSQSIAILVDTSQSMQTVDPLESAKALRWAIAGDSEEKNSPLVHCDRAKVALEMAGKACQLAQRQLTEHQPLKEIRLTVEKVNVALERADAHCAKASTELHTIYGDIAARVERVESLLEGPIAEGLEELNKSLRRGSDVAVVEITTFLESLSESISGASRRVDSLSRNLALAMADMGVLSVDLAADLSRREKTVRVLDSLEQGVLDTLAEETRILRYQFDTHLMPITLTNSWQDSDAVDDEADILQEDTGAADGQPGTDLAAVFTQLSSDRSAESIRLAILLSDGRHNAVGARAPQEIASQIGDLPVYVVPVGSSVTQRDIRLHRVKAPSTVVEKDAALIEVIVTAIDCDGITTDVVLRHDGKEIDSKSVTFDGPHIDRRVQFHVSADELGWQDYELSIAAVEDEASEANNLVPITWEVVQDKLRILLVDGVSRWEFRYLQMLFRRDSHIEFDELLFYPRLHGTGEMAANPRLPEHVDDWSVYDVVILGDIGTRQFNTASQESLDEYVREQGGNVIIISGRDHMPNKYVGRPLMDLLPVEDTPNHLLAEAYSLKFTDEGRSHGALAIENSVRESEVAWHNVYHRTPIHGISPYSRPKPTARTLLRAVPAAETVVFGARTDQTQQPAFLCWHQAGAGRVVYLSAPQTYLLRFRRGDRMHHRFWGQMLRWVTATTLGSGTELVRVSTDKPMYVLNDSVEVTVWLKDKTGRPLAGQKLEVQARVSDETVAALALESDPKSPGRYFGTFEDLKSGSYEIVVEGPIIAELLPSPEERSQLRSMILIEENDNLELLDTRSNEALLEQLAEITGGLVLPPTAIAEVLQLASLSPEVNEKVQRSPLWNSWTNLLGILGCLFIEWFVRKKRTGVT